MTMHTYADSSARIDKFKGRIMARAIPFEVLSRQGRQVSYPKNNSKTYIMRRYLPYGGGTGAISGGLDPSNTFFGTTTLIDRGEAYLNAHRSTEGVTPSPDKVTPEDVTVTMAQYSCLYGYTDHQADLGEDDIPEQELQLTAERMALVNEMICYGAWKAGTNIFYGGTGSTVATVNGTITLNMLRKIAMSIMANHGRPVSRVLSASGLFNTEPVPAGFFVFIHTDLSSDVRDLEHFVPAEKYASGKPLENELGACEEFRFIRSPDLPSKLNAATSTTASTYGLYSTTGTNPDVYTFLVLAQDAVSQVAVRGLTGMEPTHIPASRRDKSDPHGQRGYVGAIWWKAAAVENDGWLAVGHVGRTAL